MTNNPPLFNFIETYAGAKTSELKQQKENSSRRATIECSTEVKGVGQHRIRTPVLFPSPFRSEPHFVSGCATILNPASTYYHDPVGQAGVYAWQVDDRGLYRGAWMWVRVDVNEKGTAIDTGLQLQNAILAMKETDQQNKSDVEDFTFDQLTAKAKAVAQVRTLIYMTFTGPAIKDLDLSGLTVDMTPHPVEF